MYCLLDGFIVVVGLNTILVGILVKNTKTIVSASLRDINLEIIVGHSSFPCSEFYMHHYLLLHNYNLIHFFFVIPE